MKYLLIVILILLPAITIPAAGTAADLKCEKMNPGIQSLKVMNMQPLRRGKVWLEGEPVTVFQTSCDLYGLKNAETEYHQKSLVRKTLFVYRSREEAKAVCEARKSEEKLTSTFSEEARSSLDDFCRKYRKKDFDAVLIYDASPGSASATPIRQVFRLYNSKGFPSEEYEFDPAAALETRTGYKYDPKNNLTEKTDYDPGERQLRRETYASDKITASRTVSFFNENNQLAKKKVQEYREDGTLRREQVMTYDDAEQVLGRTETACGAKGARETELVFQGDLEKPVYEYRYSYKFDKKGNWIEERKTKLALYEDKRFEDPKVAPEITKREIAYYSKP